MFGTVHGKPVFGLAGHPVSSFIGAHYLLAPAVRRMARLPPAVPVTVRAKYAGSEPADPHMTHLIPVSVTGAACRPVFKESGAITSISAASGIVKQQKGMAIADGETVDVEILP
jgi:molybdopterin biosynthesis enzyme